MFQVGTHFERFEYKHEPSERIIVMRMNDKKTITVKDANSIDGRGDLILAVEDEEILRDFLGKPYLTRELLIKISHVLHSEGHIKRCVQAGKDT